MNLPGQISPHSVFRHIIPVMRPAIFLDRDGVIIENRDSYVRSWQDVQFLPNSLTAMSRLADSSLKIVIVTNQSAVGRGLISIDIAWELNEQIVNVIQQASGRVDAVYMCPHSPAEGCRCRKPKPGLFTQAANDLDLDLERSFMVGDALTDLIAADQAGIPNRFLVLTGRGKQQSHLPLADELPEFEKMASLYEVVCKLLNNQAF